MWETAWRREAVRLVHRPGRLHEPSSNRRPREMIVHDKTRLIGSLRVFSLNGIDLI